MTDIEKYAASMKEIKLRTEVIDAFLSGRLGAMYVGATIETVGLQFRKIFELIAFASLAANRDEYSAQYADFSKHWELAKLVKNLRKINPNYYPKPVVEVPSNQPGILHQLKDRDQDYLTQDDLIEAHGRCGGLMHGANPFAIPIDYAFYQRSFSVWRARMINLEDGRGNEVGYYRFEPM